MKLIKWEELPEKMKNEEVRYYYEILEKKKVHLLFKRVFDFIVALILLIVLSPIMLVISLAIKLSDKGPVFYRQVRVTQYGNEFRIFKFRTMVMNADKIGSHVTVGDDPRITKVGKKIRKLRLDEIPQLLNVLKGEMSFVGTRPEVVKYVEMYTSEMLATLLLPAGITSSTSIRFKDEDEILSGNINDVTNDEIAASIFGDIDNSTISKLDLDYKYINWVLPVKMKYNLYELSNYSFFNDIKTLLCTVYGLILK